VRAGDPFLDVGVAKGRLLVRHHHEHGLGERRGHPREPQHREARTSHAEIAEPELVDELRLTGGERPLQISISMSRPVTFTG
jgi:hypothetical protein